jgi:DNA invertase Pin-like site-specific DNA recombinase
MMEGKEKHEGKRRAIIYCRVSTEDQKDKGLSLLSQAQACLAFVEQQQWEVASVIEEDASGYLLDERPRFSEARASVRRGDADILLCYTADRMSRHQTHSLIIFDSIAEAGAELWFVRHGPIEDSPMGRAMLSLYATGAAMERENIIERTRRGKRARLLQGKVGNSGIDQYGWRRDKARGVREIYEPEARVVRMIFRWVADDHVGVYSVVRRLTEMGVPCPSVGKRSFKDGRSPGWGVAQVRRLLHDPSYKGEGAGWRFKKKKPHSRVYVMKPQDEWIKLPPETTRP